MMLHSDEVTLLDAAESLFYERGFQAVGMAALRDACDLPLKRIYALYPGKDAIAVAMLDRRDQRWMRSLTQRVQQHEDPRGRVLAIFDWLSDWLAGEGHRGCAWINAFGELGGTTPAVVEAVQRHKARFRTLVREAVAQAGASNAVADGIFLLAEGTMVTAGISGDPSAAAQARAVAESLLENSRRAYGESSGS